MPRDKQGPDGRPVDERARGTPKARNASMARTRAERLWDAVRKWVEGIALPWP